MGALSRFAFNAAKGGSAIGKMAIGGTICRAALGAGVGAAYGLATNQYDNPNMAMERVLRTATIGAGIGGLSRLFTPAVRFNGGKMTTSGMPLGLRAMPAALRGAYRVGEAGMTTAGLALKYPTTALALGAGAAAGISYGSGSPYSTRNDMMMQSTNGLVQGLHRGRHS